MNIYQSISGTIKKISDTGQGGHRIRREGNGQATQR